MLSRKKRYLQIALNSTLEEALEVLTQLPLDERIIIEAGTPLVKEYGAEAIKSIKQLWEARIFGYSAVEERASFSTPFLKKDFPNLMSFIKYILFSKKERKQNFYTTFSKEKEEFSPYIVADLKCMDRGKREVKIASQAGASAVTCLGCAPIETIDAFIEECEKYNVDAMIDMMNVKFPLEILRKLKKLPQVVILHRGVDEEKFNPEKEIPFYEIQRIKSSYDIMVSIAGGDTFTEVQRAIFNDADIVVVWKSFYKSSSDTAKLAREFLKEIR